MVHPLAGREQTPEHIAKRIAARRKNGTYQGWSGSPENIRHITSEEAREMAQRHAQGERHPRWAGDRVGSRGAHARARKLLLGQPCLHCGSTQHQRIALITGRGNRWNELHGLYSMIPTDYISLCASCHLKYDNAARRQLSHTPGE